jgi:hypothetical protein
MMPVVILSLFQKSRPFHQYKALWLSSGLDDLTNEPESSKVFACSLANLWATMYTSNLSFYISGRIDA